MPDPSTSDVRRREFLQAGAAATTAAAVLAGGAEARAQAPARPAADALPTRKLGKTGVDVTILNHGTWINPALQILVRSAYANGVRMFDTAHSYGSEPGLGKWFTDMPDVRKNIFLVTKDTPKTPKELIDQLDLRLADLKTDYVDLFFIHALGDAGIDKQLDWPKSPEFKETVEALKKSGKARFVGFSTHHARRAELLQNAAEGGFVDAIMLQYTPWLDTDSPLNKAIDACHKKGIGLISMKQIAGQFADHMAKGGVLDDVVKKVPMLQERGLTPYQGLLHAIWTDERISAACVSMRNLDQVKLNTAAARNYQPVKTADLHQLRDACLHHGQMLCADCDGRCSRAAGTTAALGDLTRYLTYYEFHGDREEARRQYAKLAHHEKDWRNADLDAAREACPNKLDFAALLPRVDDSLA